jgi:hypothetical protein
VFTTSQIDAPGLGIPGLQSTTGLNAKVKLDYRPTAADSAQLTVTRTDKRLTPQGYVSAINLVNMTNQTDGGATLVAVGARRGEIQSGDGRIVLAAAWMVAPR